MKPLTEIAFFGSKRVRVRHRVGSQNFCQLFKFLEYSSMPQIKVFNFFAKKVI